MPVQHIQAQEKEKSDGFEDIIPLVLEWFFVLLFWQNPENEHLSSAPSKLL